MKDSPLKLKLDADRKILELEGEKLRFVEAYCVTESKVEDLKSSYNNRKYGR